MNSKTVVVIPTYDEAECIEEIIFQTTCFQPEFDILVVDDNSPDGTARLVQELSKKNNRIKCLSMPRHNIRHMKGLSRWTLIFLTTQDT